VRQCRHAGDRTRRRVTPDTVLAKPDSAPGKPERLYALLEESDGVVVCCQWTPETTKLIGREAFGRHEARRILVKRRAG